jgi:tRNA uridine 5-carboxymethylaminomethyl modification enzyme
LLARLPAAREVPVEAARQVAHDVKYEGYIARQQMEINRQQRLAQKRIPPSLDYQRLRHMRIEAREKLAQVRPANLAQASRISGITPADVALLVVHLEGRTGTESTTGP